MVTVPSGTPRMGVVSNAKAGRSSLVEDHGDNGSRFVSSRKRHATKQEMTDRRAAIVDLILDVAPATVRQIYYQATVHGIDEKTDAGYEKVMAELKFLREEGEIDWDDIVDHTRSITRWARYSTVEEALRETARTYRRKLWEDSDTYIQIWLEKDALAGLLEDMVYAFDVPLCVARGYPSLSQLHDAAMELDANQDRLCWVYHLGDYDPSGQDAARHIEETLCRFAPETEIIFQRLAVTPEQIAEWNLPTRPNKPTDMRTKNFAGAASVELDAINPNEFRALVHSAIDQHIDQRKLKVLLAAEESERLLLRELAA